MANSQLGFGITGSTAGAVRALGELNKSVPFEIQKGLQAIAMDAAHQAAQKALEEPAEGKVHTGLRSNVSRGVKVVNTPNGVRVQTAMPVEDEAIIPRGLDDVRGWRHPVFGHRDRWVTQHGSFSWFTDTMQQTIGPSLAMVEETLDAAAAKVAAQT